MRTNKIVKKLALLNFVALGLFFSVNSYANSWDDYEGTTCAHKRDAIQSKIDHARGGIYQKEGLERALENLNNYCTDNDLESKYRKKVEEKTEKVSKQMQELREAQLKGDTKKIAKKEAKLLKDKNELTEAKNRLEQFYRDRSH
ncbi:DUF1090 domain-containing protein [Orbaceae bacterium ESL0721]|nr:DUF1090 domain-containing protein [Orbaceae bacterium ESL0721]